jgi:hypothetical protein
LAVKEAALSLISKKRCNMPSKKSSKSTIAKGRRLRVILRSDELAARPVCQARLGLL